MRFRKNVKELNEALAVVTHAMSAHAAKPILSCVYIECQDNELTFACSDGVMTIIYRTDAEVEAPGTVALPGRIL
jgi:DNA polymerase III sliding clamp (beta) subunit (PCNA family)